MPHINTVLYVTPTYCADSIRQLWTSWSASFGLTLPSQTDNLPLKPSERNRPGSGHPTHFLPRAVQEAAFHAARFLLICIQRGAGCFRKGFVLSPCLPRFLPGTYRRVLLGARAKRPCLDVSGCLWHARAISDTVTALHVYCST